VGALHAAGGQQGSFTSRQVGAVGRSGGSARPSSARVRGKKANRAPMPPSPRPLSQGGQGPHRGSFGDVGAGAGKKQLLMKSRPTTSDTVGTRGSGSRGGGGKGGGGGPVRRKGSGAGGGGGDVSQMQALRLIDSMRRTQNETLLAVLEEEQEKEGHREVGLHILTSTRNQK
jgi:hypothetical protein